MTPQTCPLAGRQANFFAQFTLGGFECGFFWLVTHAGWQLEREAMQGWAILAHKHDVWSLCSTVFLQRDNTDCPGRGDKAAGKCRAVWPGELALHQRPQRPVMDALNRLSDEAPDGAAGAFGHRGAT